MAPVAVALALAAGTAAACTPIKDGSRARVLLVGDSIATEISPALNAALGARGRTFRSAAVPGCAPIRGLPARDNPPLYTLFEWANACEGVWAGHDQNLDQFRPGIVVWLSVIETFPRWVDGLVFDPCCPPIPPSDDKLFQLTVEAYQHLTSRGARLVIVTMPPATNFAEDLPTRMTLLNDRLRNFGANYGVPIVDLAAVACPSGPPCPPVVDGVFLREPDGIHFSDEGSVWAARWIASFV
jgi:hypothetical protein